MSAIIVGVVGAIVAGAIVAWLTRKPPLARSVRLISVGPKDVVVVELPGRVSREAIEGVRDRLKRTWPDNEVLVHDEGAHFAVATPTGVLEIPELTPAKYEQIKNDWLSRYGDGPPAPPEPGPREPPRPPLHRPVD